jgi:hypothetical protein
MDGAQQGTAYAAQVLDFIVDADHVPDEGKRFAGVLHRYDVGDRGTIALTVGDPYQPPKIHGVAYHARTMPRRRTVASGGKYGAFRITRTICGN